jgi:hypothetical protein
MRIAGQPESLWTRRRKRLLAVALAPLPLAAAAATVLVAFADGWQLALLAGGAAGAVAATRVRFCDRAALGLLMIVLLLALGGWGPGADRRAAAPAHQGGPQANSHPHPDADRRPDDHGARS